jgi:integrase
MGKDRYAPIDTASLAFAFSYAHCAGLKPDEPLFNYTKRTLQRHVEEIYKKAGITEAGCHTLRHTCATWQLDKGIPLDTVKNNLGHESIEVTQIYLHLNIRQRSRIYSDCTRFGI